MVIDHEVRQLADRLQCSLEEAHEILMRNLSQEGRGRHHETNQYAPAEEVVTIPHHPPYQPYWV